MGVRETPNLSASPASVIRSPGARSSHKIISLTEFSKEAPFIQRVETQTTSLCQSDSIALYKVGIQIGLSLADIHQIEVNVPKFGMQSLLLQEKCPRTPTL